MGLKFYVHTDSSVLAIFFNWRNLRCLPTALARSFINGFQNRKMFRNPDKFVFFMSLITFILRCRVVSSAVKNRRRVSVGSGSQLHLTTPDRSFVDGFQNRKVFWNRNDVVSSMKWLMSLIWRFVTSYGVNKRRRVSVKTNSIAE